MTLDQLKTVCETLPFLAERRLVIVKGLLKRFEPRGKSNRRKKTTHVTNQQNEYKLLATYISLYQRYCIEDLLRNLIKIAVSKLALRFGAGSGIRMRVDHERN